jgi:nucleotidyltransferase/DNA polymerase involved in DNA repair
MNSSTAEHPVQWLFLDLNAFFASCEQQENPALRDKPVIIVQTPTDTAVAIAASYTDPKSPMEWRMGEQLRDRHYGTERGLSRTA